MQTRKASPDDANEISALILTLCDPFFENTSRSGAEAFLVSIGPEAIERYVISANFSYQVAMEGSTLAGIVAIRDNSHLYHLFVAKQFQGTGLSRRLWEVAKAQAMAAGNQGAFTVNSSLNAVPVYGKLGFTSCGEVRRMNGITFQAMKFGSPSP